MWGCCFRVLFLTRASEPVRGSGLRRCCGCLASRRGLAAGLLRVALQSSARSCRETPWAGQQMKGSNWTVVTGGGFGVALRGES